MAHSVLANRLLASLPPRDQELFSELRSVPLDLRQLVYDEGSPLKHIYFIEHGVASVIMNLANGSAVEVGMIGNEGMIGVSALLGAKTSSQHVVIQVNGSALRMSVDQCKAVFDKSDAFRKVTLRFLESFFNMTAQTAACNRLHEVEQRCARWLLMATYRGHSNRIPMTHEFLSSMLGVRRAGVTETAGNLKRAGLIRYHRGELTIIDRKGLEAAACECYNVDHERYHWLKNGNS